MLLGRVGIEQLARERPESREQERAERGDVDVDGERDDAGAAEQFLDAVALGPGTWTRLPSEVRQTCIENAPTFLDEANDPQQFCLDLEAIKTFPHPVLLSAGERSPPIYSPVLAKLADALAKAEVMTFPHAGHIPHATHPDAYVEAITNFTFKHER